MKEEIFKPIRGFERLYEVSNHGRLRSVKTNSFKSPYSDRHGYKRVDLYKEGKRKKVYIHRLVYETFVGEVEEGYEIDHDNDVRDCNHQWNLKKISRQENMKKMLANSPHVLDNLRKKRWTLAL